MLLLCGSVMEEHNNTDISDKRIPISDEQQTIYDKRKRRAEYYRQYRARKKALLVTSISDEQQQTIKDRLRRKAEYSRQYRARKKALLGTSSANKNKLTSSAYDCTVEDVEYIYNKFSLHTELAACRQPACVTELTLSECWDNVSIVTHSRHLVVAITFP